MPHSKKEGHIALNRSVGMAVGRSVDLLPTQFLTQEGFAQEASNLYSGRCVKSQGQRSCWTRTYCATDKARTLCPRSFKLCW